MKPELLQEYLRQEPFQPFSIHLRDGRVYEVRYPRICRVTRTTFLLGFPHPDPNLPDVASRFEFISPEEIARVEFIGPPQPASS